MVNIWAEMDLVVKDFSTLRRSCADSAVSDELCGGGGDDLCVVAEDGEGKVSVVLFLSPLQQLLSQHSLCSLIRLL